MQIQITNLLINQPKQTYSFEQRLILGLQDISSLPQSKRNKLVKFYMSLGLGKRYPIKLQQRYKNFRIGWKLFNVQYANSYQHVTLGTFYGTYENYIELRKKLLTIFEWALPTLKIELGKLQVLKNDKNQKKNKSSHKNHQDKIAFDVKGRCDAFQEDFFQRINELITQKSMPNYEGRKYRAHLTYVKTLEGNGQLVANHLESNQNFKAIRLSDFQLFRDQICQWNTEIKLKFKNL